MQPDLDYGYWYHDEDISSYLICSVNRNNQSCLQHFIDLVSLLYLYIVNAAYKGDVSMGKTFMAEHLW